jgi:hypothetical protein
MPRKGDHSISGLTAVDLECFSHIIPTLDITM